MHFISAKASITLTVLLVLEKLGSHLSRLVDVVDPHAMDAWRMEYNTVRTKPLDMATPAERFTPVAVEQVARTRAMQGTSWSVLLGTIWGPHVVREGEQSARRPLAYTKGSSARSEPNSLTGY